MQGKLFSPMPVFGVFFLPINYRFLREMLLLHVIANQLTHIVMTLGRLYNSLGTFDPPITPISGKYTL